jgi:hypothetical protein
MSARPWPLTLVHYRGSRVSSNLNILRRGGRFRQRVTPFPHGGDVQIHSFADKLKGLFSRFPDNCATWQIRYVRAKTVFALFDNHKICHWGCGPFNPACLRMLFSVPGGTSRLGLPATVTVPGLTECVYCRWLPAVLASLQPSCSSSLITSRNFTFAVRRTPTNLASAAIPLDRVSARPARAWLRQLLRSIRPRPAVHCSAWWRGR